MLLRVLLSFLLVSAMSAMETEEEENLDDVFAQFPVDDETTPPLTMSDLTDILQDNQTLREGGRDRGDLVETGDEDIDEQVIEAWILEKKEAKDDKKDPKATGELEAEQMRGPRRIRLFLRLLRRSRFNRFYILVLFKGKGNYKRALWDFYKFKPEHAKCWKSICVGFLGDNRIVLRGNSKHRYYTTLTIVTRFIVFKFLYYDKKLKNPYYALHYQNHY